MDKSGDGSLQTDEIKFGFDSLMIDRGGDKTEWSNEEIDEMINYVATDCEPSKEK